MITSNELLASTFLEYFDEGGVENQHGGGLLFSRDKDIMGWLFSQKK